MTTAGTSVGTSASVSETNSGTTTDGPTSTSPGDASGSNGDSSTGAVSSGSSTGGGCNYGEGVWADCLGDLDACGGTASFCAGNSSREPTAVTCVFPCDEVCDCPAPPTGFEDQLTCATLIATGSCFISCTGGLPCPAGWTCVADLACMVVL